jgi:hypothetical protein
VLKDDFVMTKLYLAFEHAILSQSTLATYYIKKMKHKRDTGNWQAHPDRR